MRLITKFGMIILCGTMLLTGCGNNEKNIEDNTNIKEESYNSEIKDVKVNELDITDFVILFEDNISDIIFEVQNNTNEIISYNTISCSIYDKNGNIMYSFENELGTLESLDEIEISHKVDIDLTKAYNVEYSLQ